jgi:hypothetical protein
VLVVLQLESDSFYFLRQIHSVINPGNWFSKNGSAPSHKYAAHFYQPIFISETPSRQLSMKKTQETSALRDTLTTFTIDF